MLGDWIVYRQKGKGLTLLSPGLMVMGGDSCSEGRGLESQPHIMDG